VTGRFISLGHLETNDVIVPCTNLKQRPESIEAHWGRRLLDGRRGNDSGGGALR